MTKLKLSDFVENPDNPQTVTDEAFDRLVAKLRRVPDGLTAMRIAYVTDHPAGRFVVLSGNKRLRALKLIHGPDATVPGEWFQDITSLTEDERREFIVDANVTEGQWDADKLLAMFDKDELADLMGQAEIDSLITTAAQPSDATPREKTDADAVPSVDETEPPVSKRGGVYRLGDHLLMCGDATSFADVQVLMAQTKSDLLITDPPYNVNYQTKAGKIENDNIDDSAFQAFLASAFKSADSVMRDGAVFYVWHASLESFNFNAAARLVGWTVREVLVWLKNTFALGRQDYQWRHELCLYGWKDGAAHKWHGGRKQSTILDLVPESVEKDETSNVMRFFVGGRTFEIAADAVVETVDTSVIAMDKPTKSKLHPTMKPVALFELQIANSSDKGDIVLDLLGGSGTTAIAAQNTNRRARLMELDEHYCDVIRKRWAEYVHGEGCDWQSLTPAAN